MSGKCLRFLFKRKKKFEYKRTTIHTEISPSKLFQHCELGLKRRFSGRKMNFVCVCQKENNDF